MFSSLPKLADRIFIVGFLLPTLLATLAVLFLFRDTQPLGAVFEAALEEKGPGDLTLLVLSIFTLATLLLLCNHPLYRLLEGYVGPFKRADWTARRQRALREAQARLRAQQAAVAAGQAHPGGDAPSEHLRRLRNLLSEFPNDPERVLPTRFGNVIRAFETYPNYVYGVESISTWLRLQAVMPKEFVTLVDDARSRVDFFVNTWFLAVVVALLAAVRTMLNLSSATSMQEISFGFPLTAAAAALLACAAYERAISVAVAWGDVVKTAFDLYLPDLAKRLGYQLLPDSGGRKRFWDALGRQFLYWQPLAPDAWPRAAEAPSQNAASRPVVTPAEEQADRD